jgi:hypothetical protein
LKPAGAAGLEPATPGFGDHPRAAHAAAFGFPKPFRVMLGRLRSPHSGNDSGNSRVRSGRGRGADIEEEHRDRAGTRLLTGGTTRSRSRGSGVPGVSAMLHPVPTPVPTWKLSKTAVVAPRRQWHTPGWGRLPFGGRLDTATFGRPQQPFRGFGHDPEPTIPVPDGSAAVMGRSSTRPSPVRARAAIAVNGVQLTARPPRATCPIRGNLRCAAQVSTLSSIYRGRASECWAPACGGGKGRTPFRGSVQLADWPKHPFRAAPWSCGSIVVRVGGGGVTGGRG